MISVLVLIDMGVVYLSLKSAFLYLLAPIFFSLLALQGSTNPIIWYLLWLKSEQSQGYFVLSQVSARILSLWVVLDISYPTNKLSKCPKTYGRVENKRPKTAWNNRLSSNEMGKSRLRVDWNLTSLQWRFISLQDVCSNVTTLCYLTVYKQVPTFTSKNLWCMKINATHKTQFVNKDLIWIQIVCDVWEMAVNDGQSELK